MDDRKKADVIALFSKMKTTSARKRIRPSEQHANGDTTIIDSTVLICPEGMMQGLLQQLLADGRMKK